MPLAVSPVSSTMQSRSLDQLKDTGTDTSDSESLARGMTPKHFARHDPLALAMIHLHQKLRHDMEQELRRGEKVLQWRFVA